MRHSWKQEKAKQIKHRKMNKQHTTQATQTPTNNNKHMCFCFVICYVMLCSLLTYKGTCGIVGNKKENNTNTGTWTNNTTTNSTNNNKQQNTHTCFLFCVLLCLFSSLLTYKGTCGTVGNKKKQNETDTEKRTNNTKKNKQHTQQQPTTKPYMFFCFVFWCVCSVRY